VVDLRWSLGLGLGNSPLQIIGRCESAGLGEGEEFLFRQGAFVSRGCISQLDWSYGEAGDGAGSDAEGGEEAADCDPTVPMKCEFEATVTGGCAGGFGIGCSHEIPVIGYAALEPGE
jgi:hypothetical protein